jgi:hypothetical protein
MNITCRKFQPLEKNTLRGFATIYVSDIDMLLHDVAVFQKNNSRWAAPPARPQLSKEGAVIRDATTGKPAYSQVIEFGSRESRDAFSKAVVDAVLKNEAGARALGVADADIPF